MRFYNIINQLKEKFSDTITIEEINLFFDFEVSDIIYNSKDTKENSIFVAIKGLTSDGHNFINDAIDKGAKAIFIEDKNILPNIKENINIIYTSSSRKILAAISNIFYNFPYKNTTLIGITGTNGKTSIAFSLYNYFYNYKDRNSGLIGTIYYKINNTTIKSKNTTPESKDYIKLLKEMVDKKVEYVSSEISSHALKLDRVFSIEYDVAIFTNLTRDHLDFHTDMEDYYNSKKLLFTDHIKNNGVSIINIDNEYGKKLFNELNRNNKYPISIKNKNAYFYISQIVLTENFSNYIISINKSQNISITTNLIGEFNVYNSAFIFATLYLLGEKIEDITEYLKEVPPIPGRLEKIKNNINRHIIIDYAHTPDALENVLKTIKKLSKKRIISVFGAGGDRDSGKRPLMGQVAEKYSDIIIITNDNPRNEDPERIVQDIIKGIDNKSKIIKILDRKEAIRKAIEISEKGDWILIAGKGHEDYQILKDKIIHFSDREVVKEILDKMETN